MTLVPYLPNLAGGLLIGLAAGSLHVMTGQVAGISSILRRAMLGPDRGWRLAFLAGLLVPGAAALMLTGRNFTAGIEQVPYSALIGAGFLVGLGSGIGNGCTSGHGICGLANLSSRSLVAVFTFMSAAALVVLVLRHGGWQ